ncbi:MAG: SMP-30/gluconolactonase/LRE family protein [Noviherbaspirillum sp.]
MNFLQPPALRDAEIFTSMPARYRRTGVRSAWADANRGGVQVDSFLEGPLLDAAGNLYVTDIPFGRIFRIDMLGQWALVAEYDGEPNGMKFLSQRELLVADYRYGLMVCEIASGAMRPYMTRRNSESFKGINDLIFDSKGNLYFTDQGQTGMHDPTGRLYRLRPNGQLELLLSNAPSPNGLALAPDEKVLYLAVTRGNAVWRIPLLDDGSVAKVGQFFSSYGPSGPDGMAMDEQGRLIVANPGLGYAWVLNHRAEPVEVLRSTEGMSLTNVAFGGVDSKTLYCTESVSGSILRAEMSVAGLPIHSGPS